MTGLTIHTATAAQRLRARPLALAAAGVVTLEALLALIGTTWAPLAVAALVLAPGLALLPLLPEPALKSPSAALAAAPALGIATASTAIITLSTVRIGLTEVSVRAAAAVLVAAGLALRASEPNLRLERGEVLAALGGAAALALGYVIQRRVIGDTPVPGNDWAKYVLYANEIARHGALLIDNPFWLLGVPFREEPGVPALYGAHLVMTDRPAVVLQQGIGLFALAQIGALYALGRALWGGAAGVIAAFLWAAVPLGYTLLGWHGLANAAALSLMALLLMYLAAFAQSRLDPPGAVGAGVVMVGVAAAHRLSFGIAVLTAGLVVAAALVSAHERRALLRPLAMAAGTGAVLGAAVAYDLLERNSSFGGTQDHTAYLASKIELDLLLRGITIPLAVAGVAALIAAPLLVRDRRSLLAPLGLLAVVVSLGYAWVAEVPLHYTRMAYYLPLAVVPLVAAALASVPRRTAGVGLGLALAAATAVAAWGQADHARRFYQIADAAATRGLGHVSAALGPGEPVVTDRCWSFLSTWLLQTRVVPALDPVDIQPKAELPFAQRAHAVLDDTRRGRQVADRLDIRFALVDPTCRDADGVLADPPQAGKPVFVSRRLVVLRVR